MVDEEQALSLKNLWGRVTVWFAQSCVGGSPGTGQVPEEGRVSWARQGWWGVGSPGRGTQEPCARRAVGAQRVWGKCRSGSARVRLAWQGSRRAGAELGC